MSPLLTSQFSPPLRTWLWLILTTFQPASVERQPRPAETIPQHPHAVARFEGKASKGLKVHLIGDDSTGGELSYLWIQTKGPVVTLDQADSPRASFIIPAEATPFRFQLVVAGPGGVDRTTLDVPLELHEPSPLTRAVIANAGEDQMAVVGRRVTLDGIRSTPGGQAAYRWIQIEGPAIANRIETSSTYSFVPTLARKHRFLLVVASNGSISEPDEVVVTVTSEPTGSEQRSAVVMAESPSNHVVRVQIGAIHDRPEVPRRLAEAFDSVADRMSLYESYDGIFSEIARLIEGIVPATAPERSRWDTQVFAPLSQQIIRDLQGVGLDLSRSQDRSRPYNTDQRAHLTSLFHRIAHEFRASINSGTALSESSGATQSQ